MLKPVEGTVVSVRSSGLLDAELYEGGTIVNRHAVFNTLKLLPLLTGHTMLSVELDDTITRIELTPKACTHLGKALLERGNGQPLSSQPIEPLPQTNEAPKVDEPSTTKE